MRKKTLIIVIITIIAFLVIFFGVLAYYQYVNHTYPLKHVEERAQKWMDENIRDADAYEYELVIHTTPDLEAMSDMTGLDEIPKYVDDHYQVTVLVDQKIMKIEKTVTERKYTNSTGTDIQTESYTDAIQYIVVNADSVDFYNASNERITFGGSDVADSFSALLFPDDLSFLGEPQVRNEGMQRNDDYFPIDVSRQISPAFLYDPFDMINATQADASALFDINLSDSENADPYAFKITLFDMADFLDYAYDTINAKDPVNSLMDDEVPYAQDIIVIFYKRHARDRRLRYFIEDFDTSNM